MTRHRGNAANAEAPAGARATIGAAAGLLARDGNAPGNVTATTTAANPDGTPTGAVGPADRRPNAPRNPVRGHPVAAAAVPAGGTVTTDVVNPGRDEKNAAKARVMTVDSAAAPAVRIRGSAGTGMTVATVAVIGTNGAGAVARVLPVTQDSNDRIGAARSDVARTGRVAVASGPAAGDSATTAPVAHGTDPAVGRVGVGNGRRVDTPIVMSAAATIDAPRGVRSAPVPGWGEEIVRTTGPGTGRTGAGVSGVVRPGRVAVMTEVAPRTGVAGTNVAERGTAGAMMAATGTRGATTAASNRATTAVAVSTGAMSVVPGRPNGRSRPVWNGTPMSLRYPRWTPNCCPVPSGPNCGGCHRKQPKRSVRTWWRPAS